MVTCHYCQKSFPSYVESDFCLAKFAKRLNRFYNPSATPVVDENHGRLYHQGCIRQIVQMARANDTEQGVYAGRDRDPILPHIFNKYVNIEGWDAHFSRTCNKSYNLAVPLVKTAASFAAYKLGENCLGIFGAYQAASIIMQLPTVQGLYCKGYEQLYLYYQDVHSYAGGSS